MRRSCVESGRTYLGRSAWLSQRGLIGSQGTMSARQKSAAGIVPTVGKAQTVTSGK